MTPSLHAAWRPSSLLSLALAAAPPLAAQPAPLPPAADTPTIVVTGNPLGSDALLRADGALSGDGLLLRRASTLGETLQAMTGVAGSGFGPHSSRPVIRGLDGERVRVLDNGGASIDASTLSFDHALASDPLVAERIEVLRGPAALLYGGNASGGVVNSIDNRIPRAPQPALAARSEWRLGGAAAERSAALVLDGGAGAFAWHADAYGRRQSDLRTPRFVPAGDDASATPVDHVPNSAARTEGGAAGLSRVDRDGFVGLSLDTHRQRYGVTVEPDVTIRLHRDRVALAGERRRLGGWIDEVSFAASHTRYRHLELEGDEVGTRFASRGHELRLQAVHRAVGPWRGVVGLQAERLNFSALGEEAFVPHTLTRSRALFVLEEGDFGAWRLQVGARREQVQVDSGGDAADAAEPRFGAAQQRRFDPFSAALGLVWRASGAWSLGLSLAHTERAPAYHELYADGVHVATAAYERGDASLGVERSRGAQATLAWRQGPQQLRLNLHDTRFSRYLLLAATGESVTTDDGDVLPVQQLQALRAHIRGAELEARWRAIESPVRLELWGTAERLRGSATDSGDPLPRMAPARLQLGLDLARGPWALGLAMRQVAAQQRVPPGDSATPGHRLWNAWASWQLPLQGGRAATLFVRADNLGDRLAYNAVAVASIRGLSPAGGRALTAGLRLQL